MESNHPVQTPKVFMVDFGGVLSHHIPSEQCHQLAASMGLRVEEILEWLFANKHSFHAMIGKISYLDVLESLSKDNDVGLDRVKMIWKEFEGSQRIDLQPLYELQTWRPKSYVVILSNHWDIGSVLIRNAIPSSLVDEFLISCELGLRKPSFEIFEFVRQRFKCEFSEMSLIDDDVDNINAARSFGIKTHQFVRKLE